jgi:hypothetical protein
MNVIWAALQAQVRLNGGEQENIMREHRRIFMKL